MRFSQFSEARINDPNVSYEDVSPEKVIATLSANKSAVYTALAKKLARVDALEKELKELKEQIKQSTRDDIADLFDATDEVKTRIVRTMSFTFSLTKNPKTTEAPRYKDILTALEEHLTPKLIKILEALKKQMVTITQKAPALSYSEKIEEGVVSDKLSSWGKALKALVRRWCISFDAELLAQERKLLSN